MSRVPGRSRVALAVRGGALIAMAQHRGAMGEADRALWQVAEASCAGRVRAADLGEPSRFAQEPGRWG
jgi:hypothetical protein